MNQRRLHVLFLNAQDGLGADVAVHVCIAHALDRSRARVSIATSMRPSDGMSAGEAFAAVPDATLLPLALGRTLSRQRGLGLAGALLDNARGAANLVRLAAWCRRNHVDVIHVTERPRQTLFGLAVARMAGCTCLIHAHISLQRHDDTRLTNWRLRQADAVVGVSNFTANTYRQVARLPADRVFAVHNAVDANLFRPRPAADGLAMRRDLGLPPDAPVIGCVARLLRWKGQATLIEAFADVRRRSPNARLVLAGLSGDVAPDGRGDFRDYLVRRASDLGLSDAVTLAGFVPQSDMPRFYSAIDLLAHPAFEEPFGLAVVEAMASGRPVVAVGNGGIPEIIRDRVDGLLVPAEQSAPLAAAISDVLHDPALARALAAAGRERVLQRFTPARQADAMLHVYAEIAARRARTAATTTSGAATAADS